tara:strand:- start:77 stop:469 length:393 start_codon:yes stop_codon:yes gene_type:complete
MNTITKAFDNLKSRVIKAHNDYIVSTSIVQSLKELNLSYLDKLSDITTKLDKAEMAMGCLVAILRQQKILTSEPVAGRNVQYTIRGNVDHKSCASIQLADGYHPAGYGFFDHIYDADTDTTTWSRMNNCD